MREDSITLATLYYFRHCIPPHCLTVAKIVLSTVHILDDLVALYGADYIKLFTEVFTETIYYSHEPSALLKVNRYHILKFPLFVCVYQSQY